MLLECAPPPTSPSSPSALPCGSALGTRAHSTPRCHATHREQSCLPPCSRQTGPYHAHPLVFQVPQHRGKLLQRLGWKGHRARSVFNNILLSFYVKREVEQGFFGSCFVGVHCSGFYHLCSLPRKAPKKQLAAEHCQHCAPTSREKHDVLLSSLPSPEPLSKQP